MKWVVIFPFFFFFFFLSILPFFSVLITLKNMYANARSNNVPDYDPKHGIEAVVRIRIRYIFTGSVFFSLQLSRIRGKNFRTHH